MEAQIKLVRFGLMVILLGFFGSCYGYTFYVGGKDGWVIHPQESYKHWAGRNRFQVNDTLVFKLKQNCDSVLVVNGDDYYKCNKSNPIQTLKDENSMFKFDRSGPFFFIGGYANNCENGQRLIIVVMAVRHHSHVPISPLAPPPAPFWMVPTGSPMLAPSPMEPTAEQPSSHAPPPAASAAARTIVGVWVGLVLVLSLVLV